MGATWLTKGGIFNSWEEKLWMKKLVYYLYINKKLHGVDLHGNFYSKATQMANHSPNPNLWMVTARPRQPLKGVGQCFSSFFISSPTFDSRFIVLPPKPEKANTR